MTKKMKNLSPEFLIVIILAIVALIAIVIMTSGAKQADLAGQAAFIKYESPEKAGILMPEKTGIVIPQSVAADGHIEKKGLQDPDDLVTSNTPMMDDPMLNTEDKVSMNPQPSP